MKKIALLVLLALPLNAFADYNFNHFSLNASQDEVDDFEGNGFGIGISRELQNQLFFTGGLGFSSMDYSEYLADFDVAVDAEIETSSIQIGLGKYFEAGQGKVVIGAGLARVDQQLTFEFDFDDGYSDVDKLKADDSGLVLFAGYILPVSSRFDVTAQMNHIEIGEGSSSVGVAASFDVSDAFALELSFTDGEADSQSIGLSARINMN